MTSREVRASLYPEALALGLRIAAGFSVAHARSCSVVVAETGDRGDRDIAC